MEVSTAYCYLEAPVTEAVDGRDDWSVATCTVHSPSSSVSASSMVADISDWSPEQLLRLNAATAADDVDRYSSVERLQLQVQTNT